MRETSPTPSSEEFCLLLDLIPVFRQHFSLVMSFYPIHYKNSSQHLLHQREKYVMSMVNDNPSTIAIMPKKLCCMHTPIKIYIIQCTHTMQLLHYFESRHNKKYIAAHMAYCKFNTSILENRQHGDKRPMF